MPRKNGFFAITLHNVDSRHYHWFDMGGINKNMIKGVANFKGGFNGLKYSYLVEFKGKGW